MSLLLPYALLGASTDGFPTLAGLTGVAGEPVDVLRSGSWIVAAGTIRETPPSDERGWRAHDRVVRALASEADALLPFRFGSVVDGMAALVARLEPQERALREALALVNRGEQMTLRVFGETEPPAPPAAGDRQDRPGTDYLMRRRAREVPGLEPLKTGTAPFVRAERLERQGPAPLLASIYHLVPRAARADYLAAAHAAAARLAPIRLSISGPWPPYAFVPEIFS